MTIICVRFVARKYKCSHFFLKRGIMSLSEFFNSKSRWASSNQEFAIVVLALIFEGKGGGATQKNDCLFFESLRNKYSVRACCVVEPLRQLSITFYRKEDRNINNRKA